MGEHKRGLGRIADDTTVGPAVAESEGRPRVQQHLAGGVQVTAGVVEDGHVQQSVAIIFEHGVVGHRERRYAGGLGDAGQRPLGAGLVLGGAAQGERAAVGLLHALSRDRVRIPRLDGIAPLVGTQGGHQLVGGQALRLQLLIGGDLVEEAVGGEVT